MRLSRFTRMQVDEALLAIDCLEDRVARLDLDVVLAAVLLALLGQHVLEWRIGG